MRSLFRLAVIFAAFFIIVFSAGCGTDTPGLPGGVTIPPVVILNSGAGFVSFNQDQSLNTPMITVSVSGQDGDALLRDLRIQENGVNIPTGQLNFLTGQTSNNPIATLGADANGFTYDIEITPSNTTAGDLTFSFVLTDVDAETAVTQLVVTYTVSPPTAELIIADGFVSGDATITSTAPSFVVQLLATRTEEDISSITVLENGLTMDASQLTFAGGTITAANPLFVAGDGGSVDIAVRPGNVLNNDVRTYTFRVTDVNGASSEQTVTITFIVPASDLEFEMMGVFFNASGGMLGGLDLDNGTAVGFNSAAAEIEDEGINLNLTGENWRRQISATNDAVLRIANLSVLGEGTTFADVLLQSQIATVFENGTPPDGSDEFPDADGDVSRNEIVTQPLVDGDVLVVSRGTRTYLVRIDAVNFVASSNDDNYTVSIKY
jgi:hypothetical protein